MAVPRRDVPSTGPLSRLCSQRNYLTEINAVLTLESLAHSLLKPPVVVEE
jgi:hypothetical protein